MDAKHFKIDLGDYIPPIIVFLDDPITAKLLLDSWDHLRDCIEKGIGQELEQCFNCGGWHTRWGAHDSCGGMGYSCSSDTKRPFNAFQGNVYKGLERD